MANTKILIVEDDRIVAEDIKISLEKLGYSICGIQAYAERVSENVKKDKPDLVLMDIMLKGEMNGTEAAGHIQKHFDIPVVYLTAHTDETVLNRAKSTEPYGYVIKPFEDRELKTAIEIALYKHKMELKLKKREAWLHTTLRSIGDAVIATDPNGNVNFMNPVAQTLTGWNEDDAIGVDLARVFNIINENTREQVENPVDKVIRIGNIVGMANHTILISKDGREVPIDDSGAPIRDEKGSLIGIVLVFRDITERRNAEVALNESVEALSSVLSNAVDPIYKYNLITSAYEYFSPSIINTHGFTPDEMIAGGVVMGFSRIHPEDLIKVKEQFDELISGVEKSFQSMLEYRFLHKTEGYRWISESRSVQYDANGIPIAIYGSYRDITGNKRVEEEKRKALDFAAEQSRHALIGQVAGKMAHDFNNVLMGIMGSAQLAIMDCEDEAIKEMLENINEYATRGRDITKNLIAYSKDQDPKQIYFKIEDKIELVLKMLEKDLKGIEVGRNYNLGTTEILGDPGMIQDAIANLIQNSIHAMSKVDEPKLSLKVYSQDDEIYLDIEDNGCGIPEEHLDSIYTPTFTLKGSQDKSESYKNGITGTGYGMSNVRKYIIEKHKGNIFIESKVGKGTTVRLVLKIIKDYLTKNEKEEITKNQIFDKKRVLLVEDEAAIADVQYRILTKAPFNHMVSIAANGEMAVDLFNRNEFDVVSLDYLLPGNINGLDVYKYIRKLNKNIPILFISGNIEFLESMEGLKKNDPKVDHLSKPIDNLTYVNKINELVGI